MANQVDLGQSIRIIRRFGHGGAASFRAYEFSSIHDQQDDLWSGMFFVQEQGSFRRGTHSGRQHSDAKTR